MKFWKLALLTLPVIAAGTSNSLAQCVGGGGVPFNCAPATPGPSDYLMGGSNSGGALNGKTVRFTLTQILGMDYSNSPVTANGITNPLNVWAGYLSGTPIPYKMTLSGSGTGLEVSNNTQLDANLSVGGNLGVAGSLSVTGSFTAGSLVITGGTAFSAPLIMNNGGAMTGAFSGNPTFLGNVTFNAGATITSGSIVSGTVDASPIGLIGPSTAAFTSLSATGSTTLSGGGTFNGTFGGTPTFNGAVTFSGGPNISNGGIFSGTFGGTPTFSGDVTLSGTAVGLAVTNNVTVGGNIGITGLSNLTGGGSLGGTFTGNPTFTSASVASTLTINPLNANPLTITNNTISLTGTGSVALTLRNLTNGNMLLQSSGQTILTLRPQANGVNGITVTENATGAGATIQQTGDSPGLLTLGAGAGGNTGYVQTLTPLKTVGGFSYGANTTYVSGVALGPPGSTANVAQSWSAVNLSGTIDTGGGLPWELLVGDALNMPAVTNGSLWGFTDQINAGYDGSRNSMVISMKKQAAAASSGLTGLGWGYTTMELFLTASVGDGGTTSRPLGVYTLFNPNLSVGTGDQVQSVLNTEHDLSVQAGTTTALKINTAFHYGVGDASHGAALPSNQSTAFADSAISIDAAPSIGNGSGKGIQVIEFGNWTQDMPWDSTPNIGSALMVAKYQQSGGLSFAGQALIDDMFLFPNVFARKTFLNNGNFIVRGNGDLISGLATIAATASGASINVTGVIAQSATVVSGANNAIVGSSISDAAGDIWQVATISGGSVATVSLVRGAAVTTAPSNPVSGQLFGSAQPVYLNVTWGPTLSTLALQSSGGLTTVGGQLTVNPTNANPLTVTNNTISLTGTGSVAMTLRNLTNGNMVLAASGQNILTLRPEPNGVNGLVVSENATSAGVTLQQSGDSPGILKLGAGAGGNTGLIQTLTPMLVQGPIAFGLSQTLVSGAIFGPAGGSSPNIAPLWYSSIMSGTMNSGTTSPFEFQVLDQINMPSPIAIWAFADNLQAGYQGNRGAFSISLTKGASGTPVGGAFTTLTVTQTAAVGDGGTASNPQVANTMANFVTNCSTGDYLVSCVQYEGDLSLAAGTHALNKTIFGLHYDQFDGAHASGATALPGTFEDDALAFSAATTIGNGTGKGIVMIQFGEYAQDIPWDTAPGIGSAIMADQLNTSHNFPLTNLTGTGAQIDDGFRLVDVFARNNFINNGAFRVDGQGNIYSGLLQIVSGSTGTLLSVSGVVEVSATVGSAGTGAFVGSEIVDSLGGIWQVATITGSGTTATPATVSLLRPASAATATATVNALLAGGNAPVVLNMTWSSPRTVLTLQPSGGTTTFGGLANLASGGIFTGTFGGSPTVSGAWTFSAANTALAVTNSASIGNTLTINPTSANPLTINNSTMSLTGTGSVQMLIRNLTAGNVVIAASGQSVLTARAGTNGVNGLVITEGAAGQGVVIQQSGDASGVLKLGAGTGSNNGVVESLVPLLVAGGVSYGSNTTYTAGVALGPANSTGASGNVAPLWFNTSLGGTVNTGAGSPFEFNVADSMNYALTGGAIFGFTETASAGYDGARSAMVVILAKNAVAATPSGNTGVGWLFQQSNFFLHASQGDGGTLSRPLGSYQVFNPDIQCNTGDWINSCQNTEHDTRLYAGTNSPIKQIEILHYGVNDAVHASGSTLAPLQIADAAVTIDASPGIGNGTGKATHLIQMGSFGQDTPWDTTPGIGTDIMNIFMNNGGNMTQAGAAYADNGFMLGPLVVSGTIFDNGNFKITGSGNAQIGLANIVTNASGAAINVSGVTEVSATVVSGTTGGPVFVGDEIVDSVEGIWQVATRTGTTAVATVIPIRPATVSGCPGPATSAVKFGGTQTSPLILNITCTPTLSTLSLQPSGGLTAMGGAATIGNTLTVNPLSANPLLISNNILQVTGTGSGSLSFETLGTGSFTFYTEHNVPQFQINDTVGATSYFRVQGGSTGPTMSVVNNVSGVMNLTTPVSGYANLTGGNGLIVGKGIQYGSAQTYVSGIGLGPPGTGVVNVAPLWYNVLASGVLNTGAGSMFETQLSDAITDTRGGPPAYWGLTQNLVSGFSGSRSEFVVIMAKNAGNAVTGSVIGYQLSNLFIHASAGDGGTSSNPIGTYQILNPDIQCNTGDWIFQCSNVEDDIRLFAGTHTPSKWIQSFHFGVNDAVHASGSSGAPLQVTDSMVVMDAAPGIGNGTGKGVNMIQFGSYGQDVPWDSTPGVGGSIFDVFMNNAANMGQAGQVYVDNGMMFGPLFVRNNFIDNGNFKVNGPSGAVQAGPVNITPTASGAAINVSGFVEVSAVVTPGSGTPGGVVFVGDEVVDAFEGIWQVSAVSGLAVSAVIPVRMAYTSVCPGTGVAANKFGGATPIFLNITCSPAHSTLSVQPSGGLTTLGGPIQFKPVSGAQLPTCNVAAQGMYAFVLDASSPTYNGTLVTGGTSPVPVACNGTNWTTH